MRQLSFTEDTLHQNNDGEIKIGNLIQDLSGGGSGSSSSRNKYRPASGTILNKSVSGIELDYKIDSMEYDSNDGTYNNSNPYTNGDYATTPLHRYETPQGASVEYDVYDMSRTDNDACGSNCESELDMEYEENYGNAERILEGFFDDNSMDTECGTALSRNQLSVKETKKTDLEKVEDENNLCKDDVINSGDMAPGQIIVSEIDSYSLSRKASEGKLSECDAQVLQPLENLHHSIESSPTPVQVEVKIEVPVEHSPKRTAAGTAYALAKTLKFMNWKNS